MAVEKLSISVPPEVAELIRQQAGLAGVSVSAWLAAAATERADHARVLAEAVAAADELLGAAVDARGAVTEAEHAWVAEVLTAAGLPARAAS